MRSVNVWKLPPPEISNPDQGRVEVKHCGSPMDYSFHGGESTWYGGNIGNASLLLQAPVPRSKRQSLSDSAVRRRGGAAGGLRVRYHMWRVMRVKRINSRPEGSRGKCLTMFLAPEVSTEILLDRRRSHRYRLAGAAAAFLARAHQRSAAPVSLAWHSERQQHFTGGLYPGSNASKLQGAAPFKPPSLLPSLTLVSRLLSLFLSPCHPVSLFLSPSLRPWRATQVILLHRSVKVSRIKLCCPSSNLISAWYAPDQHPPPLTSSSNDRWITFNRISFLWFNKEKSHPKTF